MPGAEDKPGEDGSAAYRPPEGRAGHRAGGEETDSGEQFRVHRGGGAVCGDGKMERESSFVYIGGGQCAETGRWRERERETCVEEHRPGRTRGEQLRR